MGYLGYVRVSRVNEREGPSFQSPDEQREKVTQWARLAGVEIVAWHEDLDVSGAAAKRPGLDAVLAALEAGEAEGVAVSKLDRLSRLGVADALKLVERINGSGAKIAAVDLGIDPTTPFGEFGLTLMLALAHMERRRLTEAWQAAKANAIARGALAAPTPLGYKRGDGGCLIPSEDAPKVTRLFEIAGEAGVEIAVEYARLEWPERKWSPSALRDMLSGRVYLGEVRSGDLIARDVIEPLVDETTWYRAQSKYTGRKAASLQYPLSSIVKCADCGGRMNGYRAGHKGTKRGYRCARPECASRPRILADDLEEFVHARLLKEAHRLNRTDEAMPELEAARTTAQAELESYVQTASALDADLFKLGLDARQGAYDAAQAALNAARDAELLFDLEEPTTEELARVIDTLTVRKGGNTLASRVKLKLAV